MGVKEREAANMTTKADDTIRIQSTLREYADADFETASRELLNVMGYRSERAPAMSGDVADFIAAFAAPTPDTKTERAFREHAESVKVIFQVGDAEIAQSVQPDLFDAGEFDKGRAKSFVFVAVELKGEEYPRGDYAQFVREINKRFPMPIVALFRAASGKVTLAFVNRRASKRDAERDVLGNVSLIREIEPRKPHRAHLDILRELSLSERLKWMDSRDKPRNFDGLLEAWLDALDTDALNKRFYNDLFRWFEYATEQAKFPAAGAKVLPAQEHIIRLITRMLFVWFVKEKGLVAEDLFNEAQVRRLLRNYDRDNSDSYYRAILQNLFFATLNTEIAKRKFSRQNQSTHRDPSLYRYKREIADAARLRALFAQTPFINGGLFDCLDAFEGANRGGYRIDYFSDNVIRKGTAEYGKYSIPNRLFFGTDASGGSSGLIDLFNRYKFTVEENTPAEQEVALDPELLGKVFENLLAAVNPETSETARKQTGSYYTPRAVVDYMVDEALVASLSESVQPDDGDKASLQDRLRYLLDYADAFNDADTLFSASERDAIVRAIAEIKILDPAVGSGAFPMSMLHKLTLALRRLDEDNELWKSVQIEKAGRRAAATFKTTDDQQERDAELTEISDIFEKYRVSDFGRKLYLIQNSIYGVDIQAVATQIAKLRFFISLAIEQQPDAGAGNMGIRPLPNLETRFVAANTLLGLKDANRQLSLGHTDEVRRLQDALDANRERHYHANNRSRKQAYIRQNKDLRLQLAKVLRAADFDDADAEKIAKWDPFDQNATADWFDADYMFGVKRGFDVVIGNPPYVQIQNKLDAKLKGLYRNAGYQTFAGTGDVYYLFYERGTSLAKQDAGYLCYISSNQWMRVDSGKNLRNLMESQNPIRLVNLGADVFESATVNTCVMLINRSSNKDILLASDVRNAEQQFPPDEWTYIKPANGETWMILPPVEQRVKDKMETVGTPLSEWDVQINRGLVTGYNDAFIINTATRDALIAADPKSAEIIKPVMEGEDVQRYQRQWSGSWLVNIPWHFPLHLDRKVKGVSRKAESLFKKRYPAVYDFLRSHKAGLSRRNKSETGIRYEWYALQRWGATYHQNFAKEKIVWGNMNNRANYSYATENMFISAPTTMLTPYSPYLLAVLNSSLMDWYFKLIGVERAGGYYEYKPMFIRRLPIPKIDAEAQRPFVALVDEILAAKAADPDADTSEQEEEIDWMVYDLYDLSDEEVTAIADALWDGDISDEVL